MPVIYGNVPLMCVPFGATLAMRFILYPLPKLLAKSAGRRASVRRARVRASDRGGIVMFFNVFDVFEFFIVFDVFDAFDVFEVFDVFDGFNVSGVFDVFGVFDVVWCFCVFGGFDVLCF